MKLNDNKLCINFWLGAIIVIALSWYLLFTPKGAVRRELIGMQWLTAVGGKIEEINMSRMGNDKLYTTKPKVKDENGKSYYFKCYKKNIFLKCNRVNYLK